MSENIVSPQCQYFVVRKKRLCRMTVKPGRSYCGEHEPKPVTADGQDVTRIPCPYDSKHTCYKTKLLHHLSICNARPSTPPPYVELNVNTTDDDQVPERIPLGQLPADEVARVVDKVHRLYREHIESKISTEPSHPIHTAVLPEFTERGRTEASLRHLRQASSLLHVVENEGLVNDSTCYVELGAGKGQLSLFVWRAWCENKSTDDHTNETPNKVAKTGNKLGTTGSGVLLVDRAALRHKRDAKMRIETPDNSERENWVRVRADLAHVALQQVPVVANKRHLVGIAKHLCGVATDYALRSLTNANGKASGGVLATCCHHRCQLNNYTGRRYLQDLGLSLEEQNVMLGVVSWATCGDGRGRGTCGDGHGRGTCGDGHGRGTCGHGRGRTTCGDGRGHGRATTHHNNTRLQGHDNHDTLRVGDQKHENGDKSEETLTSERLKSEVIGESSDESESLLSKCNKIVESEMISSENDIHLNNTENNGHNSQNHEHNSQNDDKTSQKVSVEEREAAGRRAKALLDYGRVLHLREHGFDARLCHFVPANVSLENLAIVAKKIKQELQ